MSDRAYLRAEPSPATLDWVRAQVGGPVTAADFLTGGVSHSNFALTVGGARDGAHPHRVVLRRWLRPNWQDDDADFDVAREVAALTLLERAGVAAPRVLAADPDGAHCEAPALLVTFLPGAPPGPDADRAPDFLPQLARAAAVLHRLPPPWPGVPAYRRYNDLLDPRPPALSRRPDVWERAFEVVAAGGPAYREVFIHRDYHQGNTLWRDGRLTAVVDWTSASYGPAGVDFGHLRWNLVVGYGQATADRLLTVIGGHHPYWDVQAVVDLLPDSLPADGLTVAELGALEPYLDGLLAQL